jgi:hypothetical protein
MDVPRFVGHRLRMRYQLHAAGVSRFGSALGSQTLGWQGPTAGRFSLFLLGRAKDIACPRCAVAFVHSASSGGAWSQGMGHADRA